MNVNTWARRVDAERGDRKLRDWNKKQKKRSNSAVGRIKLSDAGNVHQDEITPCQTYKTVRHRRVVEVN